MSDLYCNQTNAIDLTQFSATWLDDWAMIRVTGPESKSYLQGQLTCDVVSLEKDQVTFGAHCDAKGKVWSLFRVFHIEGGYALLLPRAGSEKALLEVKKYSVFSKVEIELVEEPILGLVATDLEKALDAHQSALSDLTIKAVNIDSNRQVLLGQKSDLDTFVKQSSASVIDQATWQYCDIIGGVPRVDNNNQNQHIPQAFNLQAIGGISFEKGCYTGQETVARAKYRGTNKRALFIVTGELAKNTDDTISLERAVGDNWRSAGTIIEYLTVGETAYATIILPNDTLPDAQFRVAGTDVLWSISPLPYAIDEQD